MLLFEIDGVKFYKEEFQDDYSEYVDIIPIIQEFQEALSLEKISCVDNNDCCFQTKENYFAEIKGFINEEDEFLLTEELDSEPENLELFVIRIYKCVECEKWMIDILE
ncbi:MULTISPECIES: hypothetical protein [Clostridium]|uniref:Uncharacterized protein n=1 Tax=Clostridium paridis TaxID=2803863 RepID=A0A937K5I9_9CLOT|nr:MULTISPECIES: hypothetical protein [Clostridium]MBL4932400.1 hypothetical protein [Clostridium paridis]